MSGQPVESSRAVVPTGPRTTSTPDDGHDEASARSKSPGTAEARPATVIVRGEAVSDKASSSSAKDGSKDAKAKDGKKPERKEVSPAKVQMQHQLPALADDADVGVQKEHLVSRDEKADLAFTGTLLASAAPDSAPEGHWRELRVYETNAGKHVFSRVTRTVFMKERDRHEAEIFDPAPASVPTQLLRSARDLTRSHPLGWTDAAVEFFGYTPLAKALYRKLGDQFDEHIS
jgi:hypothetical protein